MPITSQFPHQPRLRCVTMAVLVSLAVLLCWWPAFNTAADHAVETGLKRALVSFATARTLHGVISIVQGTELAVQPMGVGVTLTPGRLLTPINELTAQVADWMFWASVAFGLQKFLLDMGASTGVSVAVSALALLWLGLHLRGRSPPWLARLLVLLLFMRLVMPVTLLGSEQLFAHFLAQPYEQSQMASDRATRQLQAVQDQEQSAITPVPPAENDGNATGNWLDRLNQWGSSARDMASSPLQAAQARLAAIAAAVDQLVERLITLIAVFALQTLVLPLLLAWALLQLCRALIHTHTALPSSVEQGGKPPTVL